MVGVAAIARQKAATAVDIRRGAANIDCWRKRIKVSNFAWPEASSHTLPVGANALYQISRQMKPRKRERNEMKIVRCAIRPATNAVER